MLNVCFEQNLWFSFFPSLGTLLLKLQYELMFDYTFFLVVFDPESKSAIM